MAWYMGIDIGSSASKGALLCEGRLAARFVTPTGNHYAAAARNVRDALLEHAGIGDGDVTCRVSTGHGGGLIDFCDRHVTDVQCCAAGIHYMSPSIRSVIDVQAQSCHVITLDDRGRIRDVAGDEKCASAAGCFIDIIANVLQVSLEEVGPLSLSSRNPVTFSTGCAVFGESEAVSRVAEGAHKEDILAGVHAMLAERIMAIAGRIDFPGICALSGGGGLNLGLVKVLKDRCGDLLVPEYPEMINAIGAAVIARESDMDA